MSDNFSLMLEKMRTDFIEELPARCAKLEDAVMALEKGSPDAFDELFRQVHSLKGTGGTFGLQIISAICHDFESFITKARAKFGTAEANHSLSYIDLLRKASGSEGIKAMRSEVLTAQLQRLTALCMPAKSKVLLLEPSATARTILSASFANLPIELVSLDQGMKALIKLDAENFNVFICSGEVPDLKTDELISMLRDSGGKNSQIPIILVSSNPISDPARLGISAVVRRDPKLAGNLIAYIGNLLGWEKS